MKTYSQAGQDVFVLSLFKKGHKGTFLDIGCRLPDEINNTLLLEENGWSGLSIDIADYSEQWKVRKTPFFQTNALTCDYIELFENFRLPKIIDYLSLDIEGKGMRFKALEQVMESGYEFKVMTIEHDAYKLGASAEREPQRLLLHKLGYVLLCADVSKFEDWWINPKYFHESDYIHYVSNCLPYQNIISKVKHPTKYLVYRVSGGLNHMLVHVNNAVHFSKATKRLLIIDCLDYAFKNDFDKYFNVPNFYYETNYARFYEDPMLSKEEFEPFIKSRIKYIDGKYYLNNQLINIDVTIEAKSDEPIIYCSMLKNMKAYGEIPWYIKVNKHIVEEISKYKVPNKYIGVHYRGTDCKHDLEEFIPKILEFSNETKNVYLGTDDSSAYKRFKTLLGNEFNVIQHTKPIVVPEGSNTHYGNPNKDEVIMGALTDMYYLTNATYFIPSIRSGFSTKIIDLRKNDNFFK